MFGDADPEDAYDAGDPIDVRLRVIAAAVAAAVADPTPRAVHRRHDLSRLCRALALELAAAELAVLAHLETLA